MVHLFASTAFLIAAMFGAAVIWSMIAGNAAAIAAALRLEGAVAVPARAARRVRVRSVHATSIRMPAAAARRAA